MEEVNLVQILLRIIEVDMANMPDNGFNSFDEISYFYSDKSTNELLEIYREYYGEKEECSSSPTKKHELDLNTVLASFVAESNVYVDVCCKHCGCSGCVTVVSSESSVDW